MRRFWLLLASMTVLSLAIGFWWDAGGGQTWIAVHTGTDYCVVPPSVLTACRAYGYWSAFGGVFPWSIVALGGVFGALSLIWRHHTCQYAWWCWRRPQHKVGDTIHMICGHHHPHVTPITAKEAVTQLEGDANDPRS